MESSDFDPGVWKGHDFQDARAKYMANAGRAYDEARAQGKTLADLLPRNITTDSEHPVFFVLDESGSMEEWPATFVSKAPLLDFEGQEYFGPDMEICFMAFGDAHNNEKYPLQARPPAKGLAIKQRVDELAQEGLGGGQTRETSEIAALYLVYNVSTPNAVKPIVIFISDESPYDTISKADALKYAYVTLEERVVSTKEIFEQLKRKFVVYFIHKPYSSNLQIDKRVRRDWVELVGEEYVVDLADPNRVIDVSLGIFAKETGKNDYFDEEIKSRQTAAQVKTVYKALETIHKGNAAQKALLSGNSQTRGRDPNAPASRPLM